MTTGPVLAKVQSYAALVAATALAGCAAATGECVIHPVAELHTLAPAGVPVVRASVDGTSAAFVVDMGAASSVLTERFVQSAGLTARYTAATATGVGGQVVTGRVIVPSLTIGYATAQNVRFSSVAELNLKAADGTVIDGLFGGDFLSNYDVSFDLGSQRVGIYDTEHCDQADFLPLGKASFSSPIGQSGTRVGLRARLDGHALPFLLDSGAAATFITTDAAASMGVTAEMLAADPVVPVLGIGPRAVRAHIHTFRTLALGPEHIDAPRFAVYDGRMNVLGDDFLRINRVWVSYRTHRLFVQPLASVFHRTAAGTGSQTAPAADAH